MATSLARQLAQIAASSRSSLNIKAQRAAHSKSLLWEPAVAATQTHEAVFAACVEGSGGFEELCRLDGRFAPFAATLFAEQSQREDRTQLSAGENAELDRRVEEFLILVGGRLRLMPAIKSVEWLIRRFGIHEYSTKALITTFIPYHSMPEFLTLLSILPEKLPAEYSFLRPYAKALQAPPRSVIVHAAIQNSAFLSLLSEYTIEACRAQRHYPALVAFWAGVMTEAVNGLLDKNRSGRRAVQATNDQALLQQLGPIFAKALSMREAPGLQVAAYMAATVLVAKGSFDDVVIAAFMEQVVAGWVAESVRPGIVCLGIMAQHKPSALPPSSVTRALLRISNLTTHLVEIGQQHRIDRFAMGLCLSLVERLARKGEARGLPIVSKLVTSVVMHERQVVRVLKALLQAAYQLDGDVDGDGSLRAELGAVLAVIRQPEAPTRDAVRQALEEVEFDVEELELKLNMTILPAETAPLAAIEEGLEGGVETPAVAATTITPETVRASIEQLAESKDLANGLTSEKPGPLFEQLSRVFASVVSLQSTAPQENQQLVADFAEVKALDHEGAFGGNYAYFAFFIRIWCGPAPALVRAAALDVAKDRVKAENSPDSDAQFLVPYCVVALSDRSQRVRRAATNLLASIAARYPQDAKAKTKKSKGHQPKDHAKLYGGAGNDDGLWMAPETVGELVHGVLVSSAEECVMDPDFVHAVLQSLLDDKSSKDAGSALKSVLKKQARLQMLSFFSAHAVHTPLVSVKERLLASLNRIRSASSTSRTKVLLPVLRWWSELGADESKQVCVDAKISEATMDDRAVEVVVPTDPDGLLFLLQLTKAPTADRRRHLTTAAFKRLQTTWSSMKADAKMTVASEMLELSQTPRTGPNHDGFIAGEAAGLLSGVDLTTDILLHLLGSAHATMQALTAGGDEARLGRRRGTAVGESDFGSNSSSSSANGEATQTQQQQAWPEVGAALRRATSVLQLVEGSEPAKHGELFDGLFSVLGELQNLRVVAGSELGYLQNSVLRSLLAMMPAYQQQQQKQQQQPGNGGPSTIESSSGHGDLLVSCIQGSSSAAVQNSALLLIAGLAGTAPDVVLHSVMPMFAFVGSSVLRQADDYSAHVVNQTIAEVVPPLMASLRRGRKDEDGAVEAAAELLVSFTTAYEHVPDHRRERLFESLTATLGAREFLFAVAAMLVDRYGAGAATTRFVAELFAKFAVDVQLESVGRMLALVGGLFAEPKASLSRTLLFGGEKKKKKSEGGGVDVGDDAAAEEAAARQLAAIPILLGNKTLRTQFDGLAKRNDNHEAASRLRELYSDLLEKVLLLAASFKNQDKKNKDKNKNPLHRHCGAALAALLNLLGVGEFVKAAENLLVRPNLVLRQKVLRALEMRIEREKAGDAAARAALLGFLPKLTAVLRESSPSDDADTDAARCKHTAVSCIDKIAEKYGRRDVEAVEAAALVIASGHCLGTTDRALQTMALLCLASLIDVLRDAAVAVLPAVMPLALRYLRASIGGPEPDQSLHAAAFAFLSALAEHLPYMMGAAYLAEILEVANLSAERGGLGEDANEARRGCLSILAQKLDAGETLAALQKNWGSASFAGYNSISEYLDMLSLVVTTHPKSAIAKNANTLAAIMTSVLDLRRQTFARGVLDETTAQRLDAVEATTTDIALKMIYKLNDAAFRPVFARLLEWTAAPALPAEDGNRAVAAAVDPATAQAQRRLSVYGFLLRFFDDLKSIVTSYATYVLDDAAGALAAADLAVPAQRAAWGRALAVLARCFEHDQDDFWQQPAHFSTVLPVLAAQFLKATTTTSNNNDDVVMSSLVPTLVALAAAVDSQTHFKEINTALLRHLRSDRAEVRLAAVRAQRALTERLGEDWLAALAEMLPYIGELQDDDDEAVERETQRWIVGIEAVLGESLDSMLQ